MTEIAFKRPTEKKGKMIPPAEKLYSRAWPTVESSAKMIKAIKIPIEVESSFISNYC